jgi:hypothetical protein
MRWNGSDEPLEPHSEFDRGQIRHKMLRDRMLGRSRLIGILSQERQQIFFLAQSTLCVPICRCAQGICQAHNTRKKQEKVYIKECYTSNKASKRNLDPSKHIMVQKEMLSKTTLELIVSPRSLRLIIKLLSKSIIYNSVTAESTEVYGKWKDGDDV